MKRNKVSKKKQRISIALSLAIIVFAFYAVFTLVNQQIDITEKTEQLDELQNQIVIQEVKNDEIRQVYELNDDENDAYIERVAREEFDYSKQGERVFINVAGD